MTEHESPPESGDPRFGPAVSGSRLTATDRTGEDTTSDSRRSGEIAARRGASYLSHDDLQAHMASLLQLPNVGVLLGAGASVSAGGRILEEIKGDFAVLRSCEAKLNDSIYALEKCGMSFADVEAAWTTLQLLCEGPLGRVVPETRRKAADICRRALLKVLIEGSPIGGSGFRGSDFANHRALLRKLLLSRQAGQPAPWLFTTNYDLAVERAAEAEGVDLIDGFAGLHDRLFDPRRFELGWYSTGARGEARFGTTYAYLAKLHGSLSWLAEPTHGLIREVPSTIVVEHLDGFLRNPFKADQPRCVMIPPGVGKYLDTVGFLQGELFRRMAEFVERSHTVLIINGYGFGDRHLNRLVLGGLLNPTFHLVVCVFGWQPSGPSKELPQGAVRELFSTQHPSVTVVGGSCAEFSGLVELLPDPAILDAQSRAAGQIARELLMLAEKQGRASHGG